MLHLAAIGFDLHADAEPTLTRARGRALGRAPWVRLRLKLVKIGVVIVRSAMGVRVHLSTHGPSLSWDLPALLRCFILMKFRKLRARWFPEWSGEMAPPNVAAKYCVIRHQCAAAIPLLGLSTRPTRPERLHAKCGL